MPLRNALYKVITLPPHVVFKKALNKAKSKWSSYRKKRRDQKKPTYLLDEVPGNLSTFLKDLSLPNFKPDLSLLSHYIHHRFDLLGSGWVEVKHGMKCKGLEGYCYHSGEKIMNPANVHISQSIWQLIDPGYQPIDWQLDFKSGYRWSEQTLSTEITYGNIPGVDVKVPWELSRMQHLPQLAIGYLYTQDLQYLREFQNQVLDFIATNPPRFGVNWSCTMDVAIRVVNWLVAYDLFKSHGANLDVEFEKLFKRSILEHGAHIIHHLEWNPDLRGNHYLSNLVGLPFVASYLPPTPQVEKWLQFAVEELIQEVELQFNPDGTNFEGSTSYHCVSAELVAYATALILAKKFPLPDWYFPRLEKMLHFCVHITKDNGEIPQIGDNDSGRLLKLSPSPFNPNDRTDVIAALDGFFEKSGLIETEVIRCLSKYTKVPNHDVKNNAFSVEDEEVWNQWEDRFKRDNKTSLSFSYQKKNSVTLYGNPDFGLYLFRSPELYLAVRCGPIGQNSFGGHAHNDALSIELIIEGKEIVKDPGTYLYTPLLHRRNQYRSVKAHFCPQVAGKEPSSLDLGPFRLGSDPSAECLYFGEKGFIGRHKGYGFFVYRCIAISDDAISITDVSEGETLVPLAEALKQTREIPYSPGYGMVHKL